MGNQQESLLKHHSEKPVGGNMLKEIHITKNYLVDEQGEIYNAKTLKKKAQFVNRDGYKVIDIYVNNKATRYTMHRIVAIAFIPNPENKPCVNHIDGNKQNNKVSNLEWVTYSENAKHAVAMGLVRSRKGEENNMAKITDEQARMVCEMLRDGLRNRDIYDRTGISKHIVKQIRSGKIWKHIYKDYVFVEKPSLLSESTVRWICERLHEGLRICEVVRLAENPRIDKTKVRRIKARELYKEISKDYKF